MPRTATAVNKIAFSMTMKTMNGSPPLPYKKYSAPKATASAMCTAAQCASCVGDGSTAAAARAATRCSIINDKKRRSGGAYVRFDEKPSARLLSKKV